MTGEYKSRDLILFTNLNQNLQKRAKVHATLIKVPQTLLEYYLHDFEKENYLNKTVNPHIPEECFLSHLQELRKSELILYVEKWFPVRFTRPRQNL